MTSTQHFDSRQPNSAGTPAHPSSPGVCLGEVIRNRQDDLFPAWWTEKQKAYRQFLKSPIVEIQNPASLSEEERVALSSRLDAANMVIYRIADNATPVDHTTVLALGRQFGLTHAERNLCADEDAVSDITVRHDSVKRRYIPYSTRELSWHTDGYYNDAGSPIRSFVLHCVSQAWAGGENQLLDHDMLYGLLRQDGNIEVDALFADDTFAIPTNIDESGKILRDRFQGAVFSENGEALHVRFSARKKNIEWKAHPSILTAVEAIRYYLNHSNFVLDYRLEPGMGVISRNVLHRRNAFVDAHGVRRLFLRARYHDAIESSVLTGTRHDLAE